MRSFYPTVKKLLEEQGYWQTNNGKGSHQVWTNGEKVLTVPYNLYSRFTANGILKDAGISRKL